MWHAFRTLSCMNYDLRWPSADVWVCYRTGPGIDETACIISDTLFLLRGDHRPGYERAIRQGAAACRAYFESKRAEYNGETCEVPR